MCRFGLDLLHQAPSSDNQIEYYLNLVRQNRTNTFWEMQIPEIIDKILRAMIVKLILALLL